MSLDRAVWDEALHRTLVRLERRWLPPAAGHPDFYDYSLTPCRMLLDALDTAMPQLRGRRFLDVGCGIGTNLALMHELGFEVAGIDRDGLLIAAAHELVPEARLEVRDLFFAERFDADLVLMAHPLRDEQRQRDAEAHLVPRCEPGTLLFLPGCPVPPGCAHVDGRVCIVE